MHEQSWPTVSVSRVLSSKHLQQWLFLELDSQNKFNILKVFAYILHMYRDLQLYMPNFIFILSTKLTLFTKDSSSLDFDEIEAVLLRFLFKLRLGRFGGVAVWESLKKEFRIFIAKKIFRKNKGFFTCVPRRPICERIFGHRYRIRILFYRAIYQLFFHFAASLTLVSVKY